MITFEKNIFSPTGRIPFSSLLKRIILSIFIYLSLKLWTIYLILFVKDKRLLILINNIINSPLLLILLLIFIIIQIIKRLHDVNKSGWHIFGVLFKLKLLLEDGSDMTNKYGISPKSKKRIEFYDEIKINTHEINLNQKIGIGKLILSIFICIIIPFILSISGNQSNNVTKKDISYNEWLSNARSNFNRTVSKINIDSLSESQKATIRATNSMLIGYKDIRISNELKTDLEEKLVEISNYPNQ